MEALRLWVNGQAYAVAEIDPHTTLLNWLRDQGLTGVKEGCAEGECGACAVLLSRPDHNGGTRWDSVNSCLVTLAAVNGQSIITAEGLADGETLHQVQSVLAERGGSQCGYCTPGFVVSMAAEYYRTDRSDGQHEAPNGFDPHALSGNLCRCTGYRPIVEAAHALDRPATNDRLMTRLRDAAPQGLPLQLHHGDRSFSRPADLAAALAELAEHPNAKLLAGGTDWNVEVNLRHARASHVIAVDALPELRVFEVRPDEIVLGAGLHLSEIEERLAGRVPLLDELFPQFASRLIRNSATLGGNLGTASPIGDSAPCLLALDATLILASADGERRVPLAEYFTGYRTTKLQPGELIKAVVIPLPVAPTVAFHKVAKRRYDDISSVAVAFALTLDGDTVKQIRIGLGGVAATPLRALATEEALTGKPWTEETIDAAARIMGGEGSPISDQRASAEYRAAMLEQSLRKFYAERTEVEVEA